MAADTSTMWATTTDMVLGGTSSSSSSIVPPIVSNIGDTIVKDNSTLQSTDLTLYGQNSIVASTTSTSSSSTSTSAAAAASQYYNTSANSYPNYTMYTSANPASYYQQVASIRAQNAAAVAFPYSLTATAPPYYGSYPVDYSTYNQQYYQNISRNGYYNPLNPASYAQSIATSLSTDVNTSGTSGISGETSSSSAIGTNGFKEKKMKPKKKKTGSCSPGDETYIRVFIWDMDDISKLSKNCLAQLQQTHLMTASMNLQHMLATIVLSHFNETNDLQDGDVVNIEDAVVDETIIDGPIDNLRGLDTMRKIAPKYAAFRQFYHDISTNLIDDDFNIEKNIDVVLERCGLAGQKQYCESAVQHQTLYQERWNYANKCLQYVSKRSAESTDKYANIVICNEGVAYGAAQLLITGHCSSIPIDNIYSTTKAAKESIFEKIQSRYGKKCSFVTVTSSHETAAISKKMSIPVWQISSGDWQTSTQNYRKPINEELGTLYTAQRDFLVG